MNLYVICSKRIEPGNAAHIYAVEIDKSEALQRIERGPSRYQLRLLTVTIPPGTVEAQYPPSEVEGSVS